MDERTRLHCHIGSQIFQTTGFLLAAKKIIGQLKKWNEKFGFQPQVLNLGGGFGIRYTEEDTPIPASQLCRGNCSEVQSRASRVWTCQCLKFGLNQDVPLVGDAGTTLYKVGSEKEVPKFVNM